MTKKKYLFDCDVVIVNYNADYLLSDCVSSALEAGVSNVIIVDNLSTDNSLDFLQGHAVHENISVIHNNKNLGFAAACNIGMGASSAKRILFLNPDCVLNPDSIKHMLDIFMADSSVGMVGGLLLNPDGTEQGGGRRAVPTPWRSFVRAFGLNRYADRWPRLFFDFHLHKQPLPEVPIEVEAISGACMLVRREAMQDVGLWDEGYFLHCEDLDLCMRFRQKEWMIIFAPGAIATHYLGMCGRSRPIFVEWNKHKGMMRFYHKFFRYQYPGVLMWLVSFGIWLRFGFVAVYYSGRHIGRWVGFGR